MTQKASFSKKNSQVEAGLPAVSRLTRNMMNAGAIIALLMVVIPMIPLATRVNEFSDVVMYNMMGILNQDVGSNATRGTAVTMLMYFAVAVIAMLVGYFTAAFRQKSAAVFYALGGTSMAIFSVSWINHMFGAGESTVVGSTTRNLTQIDAAKLCFEQSPFPIFMAVLSFGLIGVGLALLLVYKEEKE